MLLHRLHSLIERNRILIDFVLMHASDDRCPYLRISILNYPLLGLLDSGASRTLIGGTAWLILQQLSLKLQKSQTYCNVATGQRCSSPGFVTCPVKAMDRLRILDILVIRDAYLINTRRRFLAFDGYSP